MIPHVKKKMGHKTQNISKELHDSISNLLGKNVKINFEVPVKLETRGEKVANKVLVLSPHRMFITTNKIPTKVEVSVHLMEIEGIESKKPNHVTFSLLHEHKPLSLFIDMQGISEGVVYLVEAIVGAFDDLYPGVPISSILNKLCVPFEVYEPSGPKKLTICDNFSMQYAAMCDLCQTPFRPEVAWDVDTIYFAHDLRHLHLKDFDHLEQRDLVPLILATTHNTWISGIVGDGSSGGASWEATWRAARGLNSVRWRNAALSSTHAARAAAALSRHSTHVLQSLDLSGNHIEDRGAMSVLTAMAQNDVGMENLNFASCGISGKAVNHLAAILSDNPNNLKTLTHLDLSNNNLKDDVNTLFAFLAQPNVLAHLDISNTETILENIWGALLRGCAHCLSFINVSKNPWAHSRRSKDPLPSFRQFHTAALSLSHLNFSYCKIPPDTLKSLLLGLACNESATNVKLNLSGVVTSSHHAHVLESCVHGVRALTELDLSETSMELDLGGIIRSVGRNDSVTHLSLSKLTGRRSHSAQILLQALVQILHESDAKIAHLDLSDCKFKSDIFSFLNALGGARKLQVLDLSGNLIGDSGARLLGKALQSNSTIQTLYIDRNGFSFQGLSEVAFGIRRSVSVKRVEYPSCDAYAAGKAACEKIAALWRDLHDHIENNPRNPLRCLILQRAWRGSYCGAALPAAAGALPPHPLAPAIHKAAVSAHSSIHHYLQRCKEVFAACGGSAIDAATQELVTLQDVKDCISIADENLQALINNAVEKLALSSCVNGDTNDEDTQFSNHLALPKSLSHSAATPLGGRKKSNGRRVRPKSMAEEQIISVNSSTEMLSLPPMSNSEAIDSIAELPNPPLNHLGKGRPKRAKTRGPTRPITDKSEDLSEGLEEFWHGSRSPPNSEDVSPLTSRSLRSLRSASPSHTTYSLTSGDSTPVLLETDVTRSQSSDNVETKKVVDKLINSSTSLAPSKSTDNVDEIVLVESCVGGSIVGITPGAALTSDVGE